MIKRRWFVIDKLNNVHIFIERALSVHDDYVRIVDGDYEFPDEFTGGANDKKPKEQDETYNFGEEDMLFAEYEKALYVLMEYNDIVARAALNEINSIIEYELKLIASVTLSKKTGKSLRESWQKNRTEAEAIIEDNYVIKLSELAGYKEVEKVRKIINAYKHDEGYSKDEYEPFGSIADIYSEVQKKYKLDIEDILEYVDLAKQFIQALPDTDLELGGDYVRRLKIMSRKKGIL